MQDLVRIAAVGTCLGRFGQCHLDAHDCLGIGLGCGRRIAQHAEHFLNVLDVARAVFLRLRILVGVVVAIGQAQAALIHRRDLLVGVVRILNGPGAEQYLAVQVLHLQLSQHGHEIAHGFGACNCVELLLNGRHSTAIHGRFVHAGTVQVTNFLVDRIALLGGSRAFQDRTQQREIVFVELSVATPGCPVRRDWVRLLPAAARILVKVDTGIDGFIHR